jgi:prepilin-type N-terminal cleavage/methylation domain-containing protein
MKGIRDARRGMTLVELMIVTVIIGVLAAIAVVGYGKYVARARLSEANAMLAEFAAKEQLYFLEAGQYVEAHSGASVFPSTSEAGDQFWPVDPSTAFDSRRTANSIYTGGVLPASWRQLGLRPRWQSLYCTYLANAGGGVDDTGAAATADAPPGTVGPTLWATPPLIPWFYVLAACNLTGSAGWPNTAGNRYVTLVALTSDSPSIRTIDENQ